VWRLGHGPALCGNEIGPQTRSSRLDHCPDMVGKKKMDDFRCSWNGDRIRPASGARLCFLLFDRIRDLTLMITISTA